MDAPIFARARGRLIAALVVITPLGFAAKLYAGPGARWLGPYGAGALYVVFWTLLAGAARPQARPWRVAGIVVVLTSLLELLQLVSTPGLDAIRSTFLGRTLIGSTFSWWDFPHYALGGVLGALLMSRLARLPELR
jgi:hypothetical protein